MSEKNSRTEEESKHGNNIPKVPTPIRNSATIIESQTLKS